MDTPKLRFNGFENPWRNILFNEMFDYLRNNSFSRDCLNYQNGSFKNIHYGDILTKFGANVNVCQTNVPFINTNISFKVDKQKLLQDGDIVFADTAEDEAVGRCIEISGAEKTKTVSGLHTIPVRPKIVFAPSFLGYDLNSKEFHNRLKPLMQGIKVISLNRTALEKIKVEYPEDIEEQRKISLFFCDFDQEINTKATEIESLRQVKTAATISMFPQKGEDAPRVRFKGFDEPWTVDSIGSLFDERTERSSNGEMLSVTMRNGVIKASENGKMDNSSEDKSHYKIVKVNDIPYNTMRMWQGACGCSDYDGIVSPAYTVLIPKNGVDPSFFAVMFKTQILLNEFKSHSQGLTSDNWNLKYAAISTIPIKHPSAIAEQQKIAEFFQNLDRQIECQTQILELLKRVKAACLDQMFV